VDDVRGLAKPAQSLHPVQKVSIQESMNCVVVGKGLPTRGNMLDPVATGVCDSFR
jgi:hypothetical protein